MHSTDEAKDEQATAASVAEPIALTCSACDAELHEDSKFCSSCGARVPEHVSDGAFSSDEIAALNLRVSDLEELVVLHAEESGRVFSRIQILEDMERRHRQVLTSSTLFSPMFGIRFVTVLGYCLLSGAIVGVLALVVSLFTGALHW
jgi:hypothetical protein